MKVTVFPDGSIYDEFRVAYPGLADPWDGSDERPKPKEVDLDELALGRMLCAGLFDYQLLHHRRQRRGGAGRMPSSCWRPASTAASSRCEDRG